MKKVVIAAAAAMLACSDGAVVPPLKPEPPTAPPTSPPVVPPPPAPPPPPPPPPPAPFDIRVVLEDSTLFSPRAMALIDSAVVRWERPLAETVVPNPLDSYRGGAVVGCGPTVEQQNPLWNAGVDIIVWIEVYDDRTGAGQCGAAVWNDMVPGGAISLNENALRAANEDPRYFRTFEDLIAHELGHVLGIDSQVLPFSRLIRNAVADGDTAYATDPHFVGEQAVAAFNAAGGEAYTGGKVPLGNHGGYAYNMNSHWSSRDGDSNVNGGRWLYDVFAGDIMGGGVSAEQYITAITLGALADLGYTVDMDLAEATVAEILALAHETRDPDLVGRVKRLFRLIQDSVGVQLIPPPAPVEPEPDLPF